MGQRTGWSSLNTKQKPPYSSHCANASVLIQRPLNFWPKCQKKKSVRPVWRLTGTWTSKTRQKTAQSNSKIPMYFVLNPFTPERDQCQNSPAASQEIWHHTVWRTWLFIAYSDEKWLHYKFSLHHSYNRFLKGWENTLFELRSEISMKYPGLISISFCR